MTTARIQRRRVHDERMSRLFDLQEKALSIKPREDVQLFKRRPRDADWKNSTAPQEGELRGSQV